MPLLEVYLSLKESYHKTTIRENIIKSNLQRHLFWIVMTTATQ